MVRTHLFSFPQKIDFETAAKYIDLVKNETGTSDFIIDLKNTEVINSSFIGLLIYLKHNRERNGGKLIIYMSPQIEKILRQLGLYDYFTTDSTKETQSKSHLDHACN